MVSKPAAPNRCRREKKTRREMSMYGRRVMKKSHEKNYCTLDMRTEETTESARLAVVGLLSLPAFKGMSLMTGHQISIIV